ncbi:KilA-N domain-containing protein [Salmonella enterica subsp. enterica]|nr:KilA-N domain-containing protein [Salmonella enterica subsp. enterica]
MVKQEQKVKQMHKVVQLMLRDIQEINMKFEVNGFDIRVDSDGYLSAADLRKASGRTDQSSEFQRWNRTDTAKNLDVQICTSKKIDSAFKQLGGRAGTWLIPEMAWGYCEYLSSEFHLAVLSSFNSAVNGDGKKAVKKAQWTEFRPLRLLVVKSVVHGHIQILL